MANQTRISVFLVGAAILGTTCLVGVSPYPAGAPYKSCANLYPKHHGSYARTDVVAPYAIDVSTSTYSPGDLLTVRFSGVGVSFKGFIAVVNRVENDTEENLGSFVSLPTTANPRYWYPANANDINCVTQWDNNDKAEVIVQWQAPPTSAVPVVVRASFVQDFETFWVDVKSDVVNGAAQAPPCEHCILPGYGEFSQDACGVTKGCLLYPNRCTGDACIHAVMWKNQADGIHFEVKSKSSGYFTFAISEDKLMGEDHTITCANLGDYVSVQFGFNPFYFNDRHRITPVREIQTQRVGDSIYAKWIHPHEVEMTHLLEANNSLHLPPTPVLKTFDLRDPWYVFLAWGNLYPGADVLGKHAEFPIVSNGKVDFMSASLVSGSVLTDNIKAHAIVMMIAWLLLAGLTRVIPRYFRDKMETMACGTQRWFQVHRSLAIIVFLLTLVMFIVIFAVLQKWTTVADTHARLGVAVMTLLLLQVLGGVMRSQLGSSRRAVFNVLHSLTGHVAHILAVCTMFLVAYADAINSALRMSLTLIFSVYVGINVIFELAIFTVIKYKTKPKVVINVDGFANGSKGTMTISDGREEPKLFCGSARLPLLGVYALIQLALTAAAVAMVLTY